jgi:hypothetical protein
MTKNLRWPLVIVASAVVLVTLAIIGVSGPARAVVVLWFLLVCTGMAFLPLAGIRLSTPLELALVPVFSVVLDTVTATALTLLGALTSTSGLLALVGLSMIGCWLQLRATPPSQVPESGDRVNGAPAAHLQEPLPSPRR